MVFLKDDLLECVVGGLTAVVGLNSPNGSHLVSAPNQAVPGVLTAFTNVVVKGPGDLANIDILP